MKLIRFISIGLLMLSAKELPAQQHDEYDCQKVNEIAEKVLTDIKTSIEPLKSKFPQLGLNGGTFTLNKYPVGDGNLILSGEEQQKMLETYTTTKVWRQLVYQKDVK